MRPSLRHCSRRVPSAMNAAKPCVALPSRRRRESLGTSRRVAFRALRPRVVSRDPRPLSRQAGIAGSQALDLLARRRQPDGRRIEPGNGFLCGLPASGRRGFYSAASGARFPALIPLKDRARRDVLLSVIEMENFFAAPQHRLLSPARETTTRETKFAEVEKYAGDELHLEHAAD